MARPLELLREAEDHLQTTRDAVHEVERREREIAAALPAARRDVERAARDVLWSEAQSMLTNLVAEALAA